MDFFQLLTNVTGDKVIPKKVGSVVRPIKRQLSMNPELLKAISILDPVHYALGDDRFYALMCYVLPRGSFFAKGIKKPEDVLEVDDGLRNRICQHFGISSSEIPVLLTVLERQGTTVDQLLEAFGVGKMVKTKPAKPKAKKVKKARRKKNAEHSGEPDDPDAGSDHEEVRDPRGPEDLL